MHLRMPSIDQGVQAGAWAVFFFFVLWFGMLALSVSRATAFILALVSAAAIFLFVRLRGEDRPGERV
jgi:ABC-type Fe3+-siderophore transport system permease subunit